MKRILKTAGAALLALGTVAGFSACESERETEEEMAMRLQQEMREDEDVSNRAIFNNLTPELLSLTERQIDTEGQIALTFDTNGRLFWKDWGRALLINRPSRLTPDPMPY